jgi:hypothetical protein
MVFQKLTYPMSCYPKLLQNNNIKKNVIHCPLFDMILSLFYVHRTYFFFLSSKTVMY